MHVGVDFPAPEGTPALAARSGEVTVAAWIEGYGKVVAVRHSASVSSLYAHLSAILVKVGQIIVGQPVGRVGSTGISSGPHLISRSACAAPRSTRCRRSASNRLLLAQSSPQYRAVLGHG